MTTEEFAKHHASLGLSNRDLAKELKTDESSVSKWLKGKPVPKYIAALLDYVVREKNGDLEFPIKLSDIIGLSRSAQAAGCTVEEYMIQLIRKDIKSPSRRDYRNIPAPAASRLNDDEPAPAAPPAKAAKSKPAA